MRIRLRPTTISDLPLLYEHQADEAACHMAAFTSADPKDRQAYVEKWTKLLANPTIIARVVLVDDKVCGTVSKYEIDGEAELTYWIDRALWGQGIASEAVRLFLNEFPLRPLNARAASDNIGSRKVLERCGFEFVRHERGYANARGEEIEEAVYILQR